MEQKNGEKSLKERIRNGHISREDVIRRLAALSETDEVAGIERIQLADVTLVPGNASAASRCLRRQADMMMAPYCVDSFSFRGV